MSSSTMAFLIAVSGLSFFFELNWLTTVGLAGAMLLSVALFFMAVRTLKAAAEADDQQS